MTEYKDHSYIRTYCGVKFPVLGPSVENIANGDFISVLPRIPRFGGHTSRFFSVAEHLLLTRKLAIVNFASQDVVDACFIHDFSETYLCDVPSPYKAIFPAYRESEEAIQKVIYERYNCPRKHDEVRSFDIAARYIEAHYLMPNKAEDWGGRLIDVLPISFNMAYINRFCRPQVYFRWKLRKLIVELCRRRNVDIF